jgi:hypothetical protein
VKLVREYLSTGSGRELWIAEEADRVGFGEEGMGNREEGIVE